MDKRKESYYHTLPVTFDYFFCRQLADLHKENASKDSAVQVSGAFSFLSCSKFTFLFPEFCASMRISQEYEKVNFRKTKCEIFHSNCFCLEIEWCVTCTNFLHVVCVLWSYKRKFRNEWRLQLPNNDSHWIPDEDLSQKIDILISSTALINILFSKNNQ